MIDGHEIAMALRNAYWAMRRGAEAAFARHGVTADQFVLLSLLAHRDGVTQQDLVRRASSDPNTVRTLLVHLENQGLLTRRPHPSDGRALSVSLTPKGRRVHAALWKAGRPLRDVLSRQFTPRTASAFVADLAQLAASASALSSAAKPGRRTAVKRAGDSEHKSSGD